MCPASMSGGIHLDDHTGLENVVCCRYSRPINSHCTAVTRILVFSPDGLPGLLAILVSLSSSDELSHGAHRAKDSSIDCTRYTPNAIKDQNPMLHHYDL